MPRRGWMDDAPESFPYRCLPLGIANSHGWDVLSPCGFEVVWNGGLAPEDVTVTTAEGTSETDAPVALFGQGTFTIHVAGLIRTPPGWNLHVSGPPNAFKDGAAPLTGIIETDWSPYTFTMNWRLTRPGQTVRFAENEPIAHFFPVQRGAVEEFAPAFARIDDDPALKQAFETWSASRNAFQAEMLNNPPSKPADKWQKLYYRGMTPDGTCPVADHQTKLQPAEFANADLTGKAVAAMAATPVTQGIHPERPASKPDWRLQKAAWLMRSLNRQRALSNRASGIPLSGPVDRDEFLDEYYAPSRPVVISGEIDDWPGRTRWTPDYLKEKIGAAPVEYQGGRNGDPAFERYKDNFARQLPFDRFIDLITRTSGNDAYLTAYNSRLNGEALRPLEAETLPLPNYLAQTPEHFGGMFWIGPAGTFTPLHHDLTNNLLVQVTGTKRILLVDALEQPKLYNDRHVFSEIQNLADPALDLDRFALLHDVNAHHIVLQPGQMLFIPIGWWHQVEALDFSVSLTFTNFLWRNDHYADYPGD